MLQSYTIPQLAGTAAGTSSATSAPINGYIEALYVANNSAGTLTVQTVASPQVTVLTMTTAGTAWYYPRVQTHLTDTTAMTFDGTRKWAERVPVNGYLRSVLNAGGTADVTVWAADV